MSARMHTRPRPADRGAVENPLPWWAVALPALAFVALLLLMLNPVHAHAESSAPAFDHVLRSLQHTVLHQTP